VLNDQRTCTIKLGICYSFLKDAASETQVKTRILNSAELGQLDQDQEMGLFTEECNTSGLWKVICTWECML